jgi:TRAP-type C4-dicarboxylate transport system permease small subunit
MNPKTTLPDQKSDRKFESDNPVLSLLNKLCNGLESAATWLGVALFSTMIVIVFYEVLMRYLFNSPTFWSEAMARAAMIWLVMLGLARGIRNLDNIRVDFLVDRFPQPLRSVCAWIRFAAVLAFSLVMIIYGGDLAIQNQSQINTGFEISVMWIYMAVPVSGTLILIFTLEHIIKGERRPF